jgi:hypothetical protein
MGVCDWSAGSPLATPEQSVDQSDGICTSRLFTTLSTVYVGGVLV